MSEPMENQGEQKSSFADRRKFPRIEVSTQVSYSVIIPSAETGVTKDLSQGGMSLEVKMKLAVGSILRLEFDLPGEPPEHITALGRVQWQVTQSTGMYATGIKFLT